MKLKIEIIKKLIKEELQKLINEAIPMSLRRRAKNYSFNGASFKVIPFPNSQVADLEEDGTIKKLADMGQEHQGFYLIRFDKESGSSSLHSEINDLANPLFSDQELKGYYPESSRDQISYVAMIQGPDDEKNKSTFDAISNELQLR